MVVVDAVAARRRGAAVADLAGSAIDSFSVRLRWRAPGDDLFADSPAGEEPPAVEAMQTGEEAAEKIEEMTEEDRKATEALFEDTAEAGEAMAAPPEAAVKETPAEETGPEPAGESVEDTKPAVKDKKARAVKAPAAEPGDMETEAELSISQEEIDKLFQ